MATSAIDDRRQPRAMLERHVQDYPEFQRAHRDFVNELERREREKGLERPVGDLRPTIWYRGQSNYRYVLLPSLHRAAYALVHEREIFDTYWRLSGVCPGTDQWTILFKMQHCGVPTRLLDWTESYQMALFFALREPERDHPVLCLFSPALLNYRHGIRNSVRATDLRNLAPSYLQYLKMVQSRQNDDVDGPVAILPPFVNARINAQRGCFTLHGRCQDPIERQCPESVARIVFTEAAAENTWPTLDVDDSVVFPDDEGRSLHIRKVFSLDHPTNRVLAYHLHARWKEDLKGAPPDWDPLFPGLRGCVLADKYIPVSVSEESPTLEHWLDDIGQESGRVCFVLGGAGAGKTNYILKAVRDRYYTEDNKPRAVAGAYSKSEIVLWCALGQMMPGQEILAAVAAALARSWQSFPFTLDVHAVRALCKAQSTVLVLDGLDELARTRGNEEARRVIRDAARELRNSHRLRVVVGCRNHIYRNMVCGWTRDLGKVTEISLSGLDEAMVANRLRIGPGTDTCRVASEVPLFLAAADRLSISPGDLGRVSNEAQLRDLILQAATSGCCEGGGSYEDEMRELGRVAALMIEKRKDYLSDEDFADHYDEEHIVRTYAGKPQWPLFVRESRKEWRFIHQSIREYLLAWSIFDGFTNSDDHGGLVNRSSSLDFESAEVYCFLHDLVAVDRSRRFEDGVRRCLEPARGCEPTSWNRRMRNLFETVGMLGVGCSDDLRRETLKTALEIIEGPQREGFPYANFVTVYNAIRCVERLHPSGPKSYCHYRRGSRREGELSERNVHFWRLDAYAVRGFHRKRQAVAVETPMPLRDRKSQASSHCIHGTGHDTELEDRTVECLRNALERLIDLPELDKYQTFVAANLSQAIIRWFPCDDEAVDWLRNQWTKAKQKCYSPVASNLELALYCRGQRKYAQRTIGNRIVASSDIRDISLLQALTTDVGLGRTGLACRLDVSIPDDSEWIWTSSQKQTFVRQTSDGKASDIQKLQQKIEYVLIDCQTNSLRLQEELKQREMKLRFGNGGTLPILEVDRTEYYCLFYREIYPIGWNIANGGSASLTELLHPMLTIWREFAEELIIIDRAEGCRYYFNEPSGSDKNRQSVLRLLDALNLTPEVGHWRHEMLRPEVISGRDSISINGGEPLTGVYLNLNMDDLGIEIDQVVRVRGLSRNVSLLDGETEDGRLADTATPGFINAPVGLFRVGQSIDFDQEFIPDVLFRNGELMCGEFGVSQSSVGDDHRRRVTEVVNEFAEERLVPLPSDSWDVYAKARDDRRAYALCPATKTLLRQYTLQLQDTRRSGQGGRAHSQQSLADG